MFTGANPDREHARGCVQAGCRPGHPQGRVWDGDSIGIRVEQHSERVGV